MGFKTLGQVQEESARRVGRIIEEGEYASLYCSIIELGGEKASLDQAYRAYERYRLSRRARYTP